MKTKPILCLDFDGVLHSYSSGWKGAAVIPDLPVTGALEFVVGALDEFRVNILSSRSHQWGGRRAMKRWLYKHLVAAAGVDFSDTPKWWADQIAKTAFADPWEEEVKWAATCVVKEVRWPFFKPPALVTIDDRAVEFTGMWPAFSDLSSFQPWNKRPLGATGKFPMPPLDEHDEGELKMALAFDPVMGIVRVEFGKPIAWLGLPPSEAMQLGKMLMTKAGAKKISFEF